MPATLSQYPLSASAFITEADAQAVCMSGTVSTQREADAIVRGVNWGASMMNTYTGRNLKDRAYTATKAAITVNSTGGTLVPGNAAATAVLQSALVGEPVVSAHLPAHTVITRAWNGTNVAISTTGLGALDGDATDSVIVGSTRMLIAGPDRVRIAFTEFPVNEVASVNLVYDDGSSDTVDWSGNAILDRDNGILMLGADAFSQITGSFGRWLDGDVHQPRIEVECRAGYVVPSATDAGHPFEVEQLAQVNRDLCVLAWQRFQTPGWAMQSAGSGPLNASFDKLGLPAGITKQLEPFMRMGR